MRREEGVFKRKSRKVKFGFILSELLADNGMLIESDGQHNDCSTPNGGIDSRCANTTHEISVEK